MSQIPSTVSELFASFGVVGNASDSTVTRGLYNSTLQHYIASYCPMGYCNSVIDKLSLARPGELCNGGYVW